jgi:hypothetical protein
LTKVEKNVAKPIITGGDAMNTNANKFKSCMLEIIKEMSNMPEKFTVPDSTCFCRNRKFDFSTLM